MKRVTVFGLPLIVLLAFAAGCHRGELAAPAGSSIPGWTELASNPVIRKGQALTGTVWNDPTVLHERDGFRMWLSGGNPRERPIRVQIYQARASDGIDWEIDTRPVFRPAPEPAWDSLRVETPSVIRVGELYHMYYTGSDREGSEKAITAIGHATSPDGVHWTRDPANPVITAQSRDPMAWGWRGAGEPAVVWNPETRQFLVYYVSMKFSPEHRNGLIGILLSTSADGSRFDPVVDEQGERRLILTRSIPDATEGAWYGDSTPDVILMDGGFHLFTAFIVAPVGPSSAVHVAIRHAISSDGIHYQVTEEPVFEAGKGDWKDHQVRSPSVLRVGNRLMMWFAGESKRPFFHAGIGLAWRTLE